MKLQSQFGLLVSIGALAIATVVLYGFSLRLALWINLTSLSLFASWQDVATAIDLPTCKGTMSSSMSEKSLNLLDDPVHDKRALVVMGRIAWLNGKCDQARDLWSQATALSPADVLALLLLGNAHYAGGNIEQAIRLYSMAGASKYLYERGVLADSQGVVAASTKWYELSAAVAPSLPAVETLHYRYIVGGQPDKAVAIWQQLAGATNDSDPVHWRAIAEAAKLTEDWEVALQAYEQQSRLTDDAFSFYLQAGYLLQQQQDYERAVDFFRRAAEVDPEDIEPYLAIGNLERKLGHYDLAVDWFERAGQIDPASELPEYSRGLVLRDQLRIAEAQQLFKSALAKNPRNSSVLYSLATGEVELGNVDQAIRYMEQAMTIVHGMAPWNWHLLLGNWYLEIGDCTNANRVYAGLTQANSQTNRALENYSAICTLKP